MGDIIFKLTLIAFAFGLLYLAYRFFIKNGMSFDCSVFMPTDSQTCGNLHRRCWERTGSLPIADWSTNDVSYLDTYTCSVCEQSAEGGRRVDVTGRHK